jgi:hypothetical protein
MSFSGWVSKVSVHARCAKADSRFDVCFMSTPWPTCTPSKKPRRVRGVSVLFIEKLRQ